MLNVMNRIPNKKSCVSYIINVNEIPKICMKLNIQMLFQYMVLGVSEVFFIFTFLCAQRLFQHWGWHHLFSSLKEHVKSGHPFLYCPWSAFSLWQCFFPSVPGFLSSFYGITDPPNLVKTSLLKKCMHSTFGIQFQGVHGTSKAHSWIPA